MGKPTVRAAAIAAVLCLAAAGLAGCLPSDFPAQPTTPAHTPSGPSSPVTTPSQTPTGAGTPSGTPTPSPTPTDPPTPLAMDCDGLIPIQALYDINPNYDVGDPVGQATPGSLADQALGYRGTACSVLRTSGSGGSAIIAISEPGRSTFAGLKAAATTVYAKSGKVTLYGTSGKLMAFSGHDWFTAEGSSRFSPDDLASILVAAVKAAG